MKHGSHANHVKFKIVMVDQLVLIVNFYKERELQLIVYLYLQQKDKWLEVVQDIQSSHQIYHLLIQMLKQMLTLNTLKNIGITC